jgi:hypothetical protein
MMCGEHSGGPDRAVAAVPAGCVDQLVFATRSEDQMTGRPASSPLLAPKLVLDSRLAARSSLPLVGLFVWTLLAASTGTLPVPRRLAEATVLAADAADYVPSVSNLPAGFREESTDAVGGDIQQTVSMSRTFVALDGSRRLLVGVALGTSVVDAQAMLDDRLNELTRFQGWRMVPSDAFGEAGYRGSVSSDDGVSRDIFLFRVKAVTAELVLASQGGTDVALLDNVARLVQARIESDSDAVAYQPGWPTKPAALPGREPPGAPTGSAGPGGIGAPGAEVTGSSTGSPVAGDTIVLLTINGLDRPWATGGSVPRPPDRMEYLTVEVQIDVAGSTQPIIALPDFWISTFDGRSWAPVPGRIPALQPGPVRQGAPARGWLTFVIPMDQPALQLTWRLRTSTDLSSQGGADQTIVIPLTVGATASAGIGTPAPPAGIPVVPPSSAPSGPSGPAGPSGPSAPSSPSGPGGGGSGRPRLQ